MKRTAQNQPPADADARRAVKPVICYPLKVEIYRPDPKALAGWVSPEPSAYSRTHGV